MDPLVAELADLADAELQWTLDLQQRDGALISAFEAVLERIRQEAIVSERASLATDRRRRISRLWERAQRAMEEIGDAKFYPVESWRGVRSQLELDL